MAFKTETDTALIDAKIILDKVLYDDDYHNTLDLLGISRDAIKQVWHGLENIIYVHGIDYNLQTSIPSEYDTTTDDAAFSALGRVYDMLNEIEDPWLWTEEEDAMGDIVQTLAAELDIAD